MLPSIYTGKQHTPTDIWTLVPITRRNKKLSQLPLSYSDALEANGYPSSIISSTLKKKPPTQSIPTPEKLVGMFFKWADPSNAYPGYACLSYRNGLTEPLTRLLRKKKVFKLSPNPIELYNKNPSPKLRGNPTISKLMWFTRSLTLIFSYTPAFLSFVKGCSLVSRKLIILNISNQRIFLIFYLGCEFNDFLGRNKTMCSRHFKDLLIFFNHHQRYFVSLGE